MNQEKQELFELAERCGVKIHKAKDKKDRDLKGIHVLNPTFIELEDCIFAAERKGYDLVVIHNSSTWVDQKKSKVKTLYSKSEF